MNAPMHQLVSTDGVGRPPAKVPPSWMVEECRVGAEDLERGQIRSAHIVPFGHQSLHGIRPMFIIS